MILSYRDLIVWRSSIDVVKVVYELSRVFPTDERFGLTSQMRRAAVSIPANIAEGHGRHHTGDYLRHLSIATGSLCELETLLTIAEQLGFLRAEDHQSVIGRTEHISRMLGGLSRALRVHRRAPTPSPQPPAPT